MTGVLRVRCRLFARYAEVVGREEVVLELPPDAVVADAVAALRAAVPRGDLLPSRPLVAVNFQHVLPGDRLKDGDELALLPPLAGG
jgi:molybdopterin converting factor small subunit